MRTTSFLVVRCDGHAQTFEFLVAAEIRAEEWARETGRPVEIWSRWTWELAETVLPDGSRQKPSRLVRATWPKQEVAPEEGLPGRDLAGGSCASGDRR